MQSELPHTIEIAYGVIVDVASMAYRQSGPGRSALYAPAEGAVVTLAIGVARKFIDRAIGTLFISPRPVDTAFQCISWHNLKKRRTDEASTKRMDTSDEFGEMVLFIYFDNCEFMTANTTHINGSGGFR